METHISFRHLEKTAEVDAFIQRELEKLSKILKTERSPINIHLVITGGPVHAHPRVELRISSPDYHLIAHHEGPDLYQQIDRVIAKMLHQLRDEKERKIDRQQSGPVS